MDFDFENQLQNQQNPSEDGYYPEYCRLFLANIALTNQIKELIEEKNTLKYRLSKYQDDDCYNSYERNQKAKRFRRNAHQIQRFYKCSVKACGKSYGSEGSLNQHYKLKHPQIYASLPNVQNPHRDSQSKSHNIYSQSKRDSSSNVNSILKELGDLKSYKDFKIEQLNFQYEENKENKENFCGNIQSNMHYRENKENFCWNLHEKTETILGKQTQKGKEKKQAGQNPSQDILKSHKTSFVSLVKKEQSTVTQDGSKVKRSSRTIKKKQFDF